MTFSVLIEAVNPNRRMRRRNPGTEKKSVGLLPPWGRRVCIYVPTCSQNKSNACGPVYFLGNIATISPSWKCRYHCKDRGVIWEEERRTIVSLHSKKNQCPKSFSFLRLAMVCRMKVTSDPEIFDKNILGAFFFFFFN